MLAGICLLILSYEHDAVCLAKKNNGHMLKEAFAGKRRPSYSHPLSTHTNILLRINQPPTHIFFPLALPLDIFSCYHFSYHLLDITFSNPCPRPVFIFKVTCAYWDSPSTLGLTMFSATQSRAKPPKWRKCHGRTERNGNELPKHSEYSTKLSMNELSGNRAPSSTRQTSYTLPL